MEIRYKLLDKTCALTKGSADSAGWDARARLEHPIVLEPMDRFAVPLGIQLELPQGWECQVRPRSGLALKHGITVLNSPGTIDSDYRGECKVILINLSKEPFVITPELRVCQLVFAPVASITIQEVHELNETERGAGGFGSTGTH